MQNISQELGYKILHQCLPNLQRFSRALIFAWSRRRRLEMEACIFRNTCSRSSRHVISTVLLGAVQKQENPDSRHPCHPQYEVPGLYAYASVFVIPGS